MRSTSQFKGPTSADARDDVMLLRAPLRQSNVIVSFFLKHRPQHALDHKHPCHHHHHNHQATLLHGLLDSSCFSMAQLKSIHARVILSGLSLDHILVLGKLVSFCALHPAGDIDYARLVFEHAPSRNRFMYNTLIRAYSNANCSSEVLVLYFRMVGSGISPNEFAAPFVIKACTSRALWGLFLLVHGQSVKLGIGSQVCVQNALIKGYVSLGSLSDARRMFDGISERTLVSWNSMIGGYSRIGLSGEAFQLLGEMQAVGLQPDKFTLVGLISVCSQTSDLSYGRFIHVYILVSGIVIDLIVRNALLDMYAKCGCLDSARSVFERMPEKDVVSWTSMVDCYAKHGFMDLAHECFRGMLNKNVVSWNTLISAYVQNGRCIEAVDLFHEMRSSEFMPDETTLKIVLSACGQIGDAVTGEAIDEYIHGSGFEQSVGLDNALIAMYAKCGALEMAMRIFHSMPRKNLVSWNVVIGALALHGRGAEVIDLFEKMRPACVSPDGITFTGVLSACCHGGLLDIGREYFRLMKTEYHIPYEIEHYACLVDLLGRGGLFDEAIRLIRSMPMRPDVVIWGALLGAARIRGCADIGDLILKQLLELLPHSSGLCVLLSNLYSEVGRWEDMRKIRRIMNEGNIGKCIAVSFIEIDGHVHEFMVDDKRSEMFGSLYSALDQLTDHLKSEGCICDLLHVEGT